MTEAVGAAGTPVKVGEAMLALAAKLVVTVVAKLASSPKAAANSSRVSNSAGAEAITFVTAVVIAAST